MGRRRVYSGAVLAGVMLAGCVAPPSVRRAENRWDNNHISRMGDVVGPEPVQPLFRTDPVPNRADTVAIWVHPTEPRRSLIFGADASRRGGIHVYDVRANKLQFISGIRLPYGLRVISGFSLAGTSTDLLATIERDTGRLRLFAINSTNRRLREVSGETKLLAQETGVDAGAMGLALHRSKDGRTFAVISRKRNDNGAGILYVYELVDDQGKVSVRYVRDVGEFSRRGIVDRMVVDDFYGTAFYADRMVGIRKVKVLPGEGDEEGELTRFAEDGWERFCAGLAIFPTDRPGFGFLLAADRQERLTTIRFFKREGEVDAPEKHETLINMATLATRLVGDIAVTPQSLPRFPEGLLVASNQETMTFEFYSWREIRTQYASARNRR